LTFARDPLGSTQTRRLRTAERWTSRPGVPAGEYVDFAFDTAFEKKQDAVETMTVIREADGRWRGAAYHGTAQPAPCPASRAGPSALPPPPAALGLDPFYRKYLDAGGGIPVVSSARASDRALLAARDIVEHMLRKRPDVRDHIIRGRIRVVVMAPDEQ